MEEVVSIVKLKLFGNGFRSFKIELHSTLLSMIYAITSSKKVDLAIFGPLLERYDISFIWSEATFVEALIEIKGHGNVTSTLYLMNVECVVELLERHNGVIYSRTPKLIKGY
ncbi:hypothetical protein HPP92_023881 [Vanilla planifolia]|uniref:Uncharacterized protein n=1 Tax=Vanilla planifolia TaxID=51239 RepID=A0A835PMV7_VANPL|nr:hypothetical protein HPP92_023881 [Vanilla planifolia]